MRVWSFVQEYSLLLILGTLVALAWANGDPAAYHSFVEHNLLTNSWVGHLHDDGHGHVVRELTIHYLINDVLMALFFAIAGKEVWEAVILENGSLRGRKAMTPLIATAGGVIGPVVVYLLGAMMIGQLSTLSQGWAIPTATDIAFSYLIGRLVFGARHPAVSFLLLLAIADDAVGLLILAVFYPTGELQPIWLLLSLAAALVAYVGFNWLPRRMDRGDQDRPNSTWIREKLRFWPYLALGAVSWYGFQMAGIHPALGLLPIIPAMPHADIAYGIFAEEEEHLTDTLNDFEHTMKTPVQVILLFFGLVNAGVEFSTIGAVTWLVLAGLVIGKPLGIYAMGRFAADGLKLGLPAGMTRNDLLVLGFVAAIGFTVALFVAGVAFKGHGEILDGAKMGALLSFFAAAIAIAAGIIFRIKKVN